MKSGDTVSSLLFNIILKGIVRKPGLQRSGVVDEYIYHGTLVACESCEIKKRIAAANRAFHGLHSNKVHIKSRILQVHSKSELYRALFLPLALNSRESWTLQNIIEEHSVSLSVKPSNQYSAKSWIIVCGAGE